MAINSKLSCFSLLFFIIFKNIRFQSSKWSVIANLWKMSELDSSTKLLKKLNLYISVPQSTDFYDNFR